jgi:hypothetical protein
MMRISKGDKNADVTNPHSEFYRNEKGVADVGQPLYFYGAPGRIRTCDLRIRSPALYPAELRARDKQFESGMLHRI